MRQLISFGLFFILLSAYAQERPFINNLDKTSGTVGETVNISGSGFPAVASLQVNFGAGVATVVSAGDNLVTVTVPSTATVAPIQITNLSSGLSCISSQVFVPSFSGDGFDETAVDAQEVFETSIKFTYDICACDFDGDGKTDVAVANDSEDSGVNTIFKNNSTLTTTTFTNQTVASDFESIITECGDFDGDGLPDLVYVTSDNQEATQITVSQNTSTSGTISFGTTLKLSTPAQSDGNLRNLRRFKIADMDGDGQQDMVIGNQSDNTLLVYLNTTSGSTISFADPVEITVSGAANVGAIDVGDLNADGLPDVVVAPYNENGAAIYVMENTSTTGSVELTLATTLTASDTWRNVIIGDFNNDNLKDIAISSILNDVVRVYRNTTSGSISFSSTAVSVSMTDPWGLSLADMDGDGLVDILVAPTQASIYVMENQSSGSTISFAVKTIAVTSTNRNIEGFDMNGDAKPDLAFINNSSETALGNLSVIANRNCLVPEISPTDLTFCLLSPFTLSATKTAEATYSWAISSGDATISSSDDEATITVNSGSSVTVEVTITSNDGYCSDVATATFAVSSGTQPDIPTITNSAGGTVCNGDDFTLSGPSGYDTYLWTLPDGSSFTGSASFSISEATAADAGIYKLRVMETGSCYSEEGVVTVAIDQPPAVSIQNTGDDSFCEGTTVTLTTADYDGYTYQWMKDGTNISGATAYSVAVTASGSYSVAIIDASGCQNVSESYSVSTVALPTGSLSAPDETCENVSTLFDASASSGADGFDLSYSWDFGDGVTETTAEDTLSHTYDATGTYEVMLSVGYSDVGSCEVTITKSVVVSEAPSIDEIEAAISPTEDDREKCPEDSLELTLTGYSGYEWTVDGEVISTSETAYVTTGDDEDEVTVEVNVTTSIGCVVTGATVTVSNYENSRITISSPDYTIENDTITLEDNESSVTLTASNGSDYIWSSSAVLDNTSSSTTTVYPVSRYTTVSVEGVDAIHGCETTASVVIATPGILPRNSFSPNGDGLGYDYWEILNSDNLEGCTVYVVDQRGRQVFKGESPFTDNRVWNGNVNNGSTKAPEGVYFYIIKCEDASYNQTGSILLAR